MAVKKDAKPKKAKDLEISKTKGGETVKGGAQTIHLKLSAFKKLGGIE